jgi:glc operon protein GlcG
MQHLPHISAAGARRAIDAISTELAARGATGVIAVADAHGELIALLRLDGAPLQSVTIATNKAFSSARERKSTLALGTKLRERGTDIAFYGDPRFVGWGGGVPVMVGAHCAGAVAVSGLSQEEDEALALLGVAALLAGD